MFLTRGRLQSLNNSITRNVNLSVGLFVAIFCRRRLEVITENPTPTKGFPLLSLTRGLSNKRK